MKPLDKYILIALMSEEKDSGYVVANSKTNGKATVLAVGENVTSVEVGDTVYVKPNSMIQVETNYVVKEEDILCLNK